MPTIEARFEDNSTLKMEFATYEQFDTVKKSVVSLSSVNFLESCIKPVRTDTACNFAKDFFLPTTVNGAIKVENLALKIFAIIGALILDLITLPIRMFRAIPRFSETGAHKEQVKPFKEILKNHGATEAQLSFDTLILHSKWTGPGERLLHDTTAPANFEEKTRIYFKELPILDAPTSFHSSSSWQSGH